MTNLESKSSEINFKNQVGKLKFSKALILFKRRADIRYYRKGRGSDLLCYR